MADNKAGMSDTSESAEKVPDDPEAATGVKFSLSGVRSALSAARDYARYSDQFVRTRPVVAIGIAVGVGVVVGAWIFASASTIRKPR